MGRVAQSVRDSLAKNSVWQRRPRSSSCPDLWEVKFTVLSLVLVKSRDRPQKLTNRRKRRPKRDVLSDACNTTADSSTSFPLSARRRDPTPTANAPKICDLAR